MCGYVYIRIRFPFGGWCLAELSSNFVPSSATMKHRSLVILFCCTSMTMVPVKSENWVWGEAGGREDTSITATEYRARENLRRGETAEYGERNYRPFVGETHRPGKGVLVGPGGPTGIVNRPHMVGGIGPSSLPAWVKDDLRYHEYDTCLCRYSFNCPSSGLKFGSCSRNKKYCCFNGRKNPELLPVRSERNEYRPADTNWRNENN